MNSLNLRQVCGGDTIKQADFGSELAFELLDEQYVKFREPLGEAAKVILKKDNTAIYQKSVPITQNTVLFKFDKILPVGSYVLEIIVGDYVFPSNNRVIITVEQTYGDFEPEYLVKVSYEELKADVDDLKSKVTALEERPIVDTALTERVEALEAKEDKDTVYDDSNLKAQIVELESKLQSLITVRRAPTGYTLDRTTTPWTVWFDNGCGLKLPEYPKTETIYGYGFKGDCYNTNITTYPLPPIIMSISHGTLTLDKLKSITNGGYADYWGDTTTVLNAINSKHKYNWDNARFNKEALTHDNYTYNRQKNLIRVMYELGIWSEADVLYLGATKK